MICKPFSLFNWIGNHDMSRANTGSEQIRWPQQCPGLVVVREFGNLRIFCPLDSYQLPIPLWTGKDGWAGISWLSSPRGLWGDLNAGFYWRSSDSQGGVHKVFMSTQDQVRSPHFLNQYSF